MTNYEFTILTMGFFLQTSATFAFIISGMCAPYDSVALGLSIITRAIRTLFFTRAIRGLFIITRAIRGLFIITRAIRTFFFFTRAIRGLFIFTRTIRGFFFSVRNFSVHRLFIILRAIRAVFLLSVRNFLVHGIIFIVRTTRVFAESTFFITRTARALSEFTIFLFRDCKFYQCSASFVRRHYIQSRCFLNNQQHGASSAICHRFTQHRHFLSNSQVDTSIARRNFHRLLIQDHTIAYIFRHRFHWQSHTIAYILQIKQIRHFLNKAQRTFHAIFPMSRFYAVILKSQVYCHVASVQISRVTPSQESFYVITVYVATVLLFTTATANRLIFITFSLTEMNLDNHSNEGSNYTSSLDSSSSSSEDFDDSLLLDTPTGTFSGSFFPSAASSSSSSSGSSSSSSLNMVEQQQADASNISFNATISNEVFNRALANLNLDDLTSASSTVVVGGNVNLAFNDAPQPDDSNQRGVQTPKRVRASFSISQMAAYMAALSANQQDPFKVMNVSVKDKNKCYTNFSLTTQLGILERNLLKADLLAPFHIVYPVLDNNGDITARLQMEDGTNAKSRYLIKDFLRISVQDVANSCKYLYDYGLRQLQLREDMDYSFHYFEKNVESVLYNRVHSNMLQFDRKCQGGPLFLSLLLNELTTNNEAVKTQIIDIVSTYNIKSSHPGEIIPDVVDLLTSISETLYSLRDNSFPDQYVRKIASVLTTTSVPEFNDQFSDIATTLRYSAASSNLSGNYVLQRRALSNDKPSLTHILGLARNLYRDMSIDGTWAKYITVQAQSTLTASPSEPVPILPDSPKYNPNINCFNCQGIEGRDCHHHLRDCPFPLDQKRIESNRNKFTPRQPTRHKKSKGQFDEKGRFWFRKPEDGENGKRFIKDKPYKYNTSSKRWELIETPPSGVPEVPGVPGTIAAVVPAVPSAAQTPGEEDSNASQSQHPASNAARREELRVQMLALKAQHDALL